MTDQASVDTLAPEETADIGAVWDRLNAAPTGEAEVSDDQEKAESPEGDEPAAVEDSAEADRPDSSDDQDEAVEGDESDQKKSEPPSILPRDVKQNWDKIPEEAQAAILNSQKRMAETLTAQNRLVQGLKPVQDALTQVIQEYPHLSNSKPGDVARDLVAMARIGQRMNSDPVEAVKELAAKYGFEKKLIEAFGGDASGVQDTSGMMREIQQLRAQVSQYTNPQFMQQQIQRVTSEQSALERVNNFARTAEYWQDVEPYLQSVIPVVQAKLGAGASDEDVLSAAYDLAVSQFVPNAVKAAAPLSGEDKAAPDPERAKSAAKAKSVNLKERGSGKTRELSERDQLSAIWDKHNK